MAKREVKFEGLDKVFNNPGEQLTHDEVLATIRNRETFLQNKTDEEKFSYFVKVAAHLMNCKKCRMDARQIVEEQK